VFFSTSMQVHPIMMVRVRAQSVRLRTQLFQVGTLLL
jgi:hypothetical protein